MKTIIYTILLCWGLIPNLDAQSSRYDDLYYEILSNSKKRSDRSSSRNYQNENTKSGSAYYDYDRRNYNRERPQRQQFVLVQTHFKRYFHNSIWFQNSIQQIFRNNQSAYMQYHFFPEPYLIYDQRIDIYLEKASVSPDKVSQTICEKYSKVRNPIAMHKDGKLRRDPYAIMKGQLLTFHQSKKSKVILNIKITDKSGRRILKQDFLEGQDYWSNDYAKYAGRQSLAAKCGPEYGCELRFPTDDELLQKAIYSVSPDLIRLINRRSYY